MTAPPFPWHDEFYLRNAKPDPVAVAARVLDLVEDLHATAQEENGDEGQWIAYGLAQTARALYAGGHVHALGLLLTGLETLVPAERRQKWALHDVAADQVSPCRTGFRNGIAKFEPPIGATH